MLGVVVVLAAGVLLTAYILGVHLRRREQATGILALAGMHWREFQRLVTEALRERGYRQKPQDDEVGDDALSEFEKAGRLWLLATKHGAQYVATAPVIAEFASTLRLRGAAGGWMTALGPTASDCIALARVQNIEILDGRTLWNEIVPLLEPEQRAEIIGAARKRAWRYVAACWIVVLAVCTSLWMLAPPAADKPSSRTPDMASSAAPQIFSPAEQPELPPPTDPGLLAERRARVVASVTTLSWVDKAAWSTQSTLLIHLATDAEADKRELCSLIEPYPELRASRLQLQPPPGSEQPVRFMQCRSF